VLGGAMTTSSSSKMLLAKPQPGKASQPLRATPLTGGLAEPGALWSDGGRVGL